MKLADLLLLSVAQPGRDREMALLPTPQPLEAARPSKTRINCDPTQTHRVGVGSAGELPAVADVSLTKGEAISTVWLDFSMWGVCALLSPLHLVNGRAHPRSTPDGDFQQHDHRLQHGRHPDRNRVRSTDPWWHQRQTALVLSTPTVALSALMETTPFSLIRRCWALEPARR